MRGREITFRSGTVSLIGTLLIPLDPRGVAVLLSGSGPLDRDSNHKRLHLRVMALLAEALAGSGWASLRYDKRGVGASGGDYWAAGLNDNIHDARSAVHEARRLVGGPVVIIGHSEGAVIATDLATDPGLVDAGVLLSGIAGTGERTLRWQARQLEHQLPRLARAMMRLLGTSVAKQQGKQLARLAASTHDTVRVQLVAKINARWFREFMAYDAAAALAGARVPILAITGSKDVQVDPGDLEVMRAVAGERIQTDLIPDVDHILRHELKPSSSPRAYKKQATAPLDPRVVAQVTAWLDEAFPGR